MKTVMNDAFVKLSRETSKYNKYMKWHVEYFRNDMSPLSSEWFRTQKRAKEAMEKAIDTGKRGFPIGNHLSYTEYQVI